MPETAEQQRKAVPRRGEPTLRLQQDDIEQPRPESGFGDQNEGAAIMPDAGDDDGPRAIGGVADGDAAGRQGAPQRP